MITKTVDKTSVAEAAVCLKNGGLVVFPTETVYGLGADAFNEDAVKSIFTAKGRPGDNPLIVHIANMDNLSHLAKNIPHFAKSLIDKFWPGPLTLIFEKQDNVPLSVTAGLDTVAVRFPSNPVAQELITLSTGYVAAPSANLSGSPSPTVYRHVLDDMNGRVDYIINGDGCEIGLESTVVDVSGSYPVVLRPGGITLSMLKDVVPETIMDSKIFQFVDKPKCPGMKYTHYSPKADVIVVSGDKESRRKYIQNEILNKDSVGVLSFDGNTYQNADCVISAGDDMHSYAKTLFYNLRLFDEHNIKTVYAEFKEQDGIGVAVKNRLFKSAGFNIVNV